MANRRSRNLRLGLTLGSASALAAWGMLETGLHATWIPADPASVAIVRTDYYYPTHAQIQTMVRQAVALAGGLDGIVSPGDDVVIKPNCVSTVWAKGSGVVTNCEVTREVVRICQELALAGDRQLQELGYERGKNCQSQCHQNQDRTRIPSSFTVSATTPPSPEKSAHDPVAQQDNYSYHDHC